MLGRDVCKMHVILFGFVWIGMGWGLGWGGVDRWGRRCVLMLVTMRVCVL